MNIKTAKLSGAALDWAVAKAWQPVYSAAALLTAVLQDGYHPSTNWEQGGLIIQREKIGVGHTTEGGETWLAAMSDDPFYISGPTALIAAMRCYVTSKLGEWVEVPEELL